ncbi:MAG: DUF47 family protein [Desulfohalobiaceae bacterium]|nr:DUF47 family protein [Desulfohalobiaceae bacterium]
MALGILTRQIRLEKKIDEFMNAVSESGLMFEQGLQDFLINNQDAFDEKLQQMLNCEHRADSLRREIEEELYSKTLIPESRGDVLALLENSDTLLDDFKELLWQFDIERPSIPSEYHQELASLTRCVVEAVEATVRSCRAFFKDLASVSGIMHKVSYWETESDIIVTRLQRAFFQNKALELCQKNQLKGFALGIARVADKAEDVADRLSIYVIKRSL